ncbi:hypothetical protein BC936DRAFT_149166 [Jimgerdemannia flammicorona]|uniref:GH18 domain-containing protein n=1 Tax=Jimgerdemannia flammicorona TaxID=994334 RepID=A0A433D1F3_9FUNG|nr:hypothetical protein BC936DRAFT_149166 [Jimgerdemannia flammicorona]
MQHGQLFVFAAALIGAVASVPQIDKKPGKGLHKGHGHGGKKRDHKGHPDDKIILGYWSDRTNDVYPATAVPWKKLTHVNYALIVFGEDFRMQTLCNSTFQPVRNCTNGHALLGGLVKEAHNTASKSKPLWAGASRDGWENSQFFSYAVGSLTDRLNVTKIVDFKIVDFNLDVIDIDWVRSIQHPTRYNYLRPISHSGMAYNIQSPNDNTGPYQRAACRPRPPLAGKQRKNITTVVSVTTFTDASDNSMANAYDLNGPWDTNAAPNGPLYNIRSTSVAAGMLKNKIVIGTPWYSHSGLATSVPAGADFYVPIDPQTPKGDRDDIPVADNCPGQTKAFSGQWKFKNYFHQKVLKNPTTANAPWVRHFDPVTSIPLLRPHGFVDRQGDVREVWRTAGPWPLDMVT